MPKSKLTSLAAALAAFGFAAAEGADTLPGTAEAEDTVASRERADETRTTTMLATTAARVLHALTQARADFDQYYLETVKTRLDRASTLLDIMQAALPTAQVSYQLWTARRRLENAPLPELVAELVPLHAGLKRLADSLPVGSAQHCLDEASQALQAGARQRARHALEAADTALRCPELDLPLTGARQSVAAAWTALNKGDHLAVGELLQVAADNVMLLTGAGEPLVAAKTLLWRACWAATTGQPEQVNRYLVQALTSLSQVETISGDANSRCRVGELRDQVAALSNNGWRPTSLEPLWWRAQALAERALEYRALHWQCQQPDSAYKAALIEAKCHLVYAETSQAITEPADTAMTELQRVSACLEQAATTAGPRPRARIASLQEPLQRLVVAADDSSPVAAYQSLQAGLRQLLGLG